MKQDLQLTDLAVRFPALMFDLRYATANNIAGYAIYSEARALLHPAAANVLQRSIDIAELAGLRLLILDAYRPQQAQYHLWDACPDENYVVPPAQGSNHSRGVAIDLTLVDGEGRELDMGTAFDAMEKQSHPFHPDVAQEAQRHRLMLNAVMLNGGFVGMPTEWWHFELPEAAEYPLLPEQFSCVRRKNNV
ncbi:D-alanyl-D-alanine dipeptidase (plasmid) [Sodalis praecaptivus]|uniref:D-alanyl-D-alanine dipeptidase n=1 Tax=Sodalis praecaptivus TaxID=1239307 RepID=W0HZL8_9GAMM|nr:D-alanyl-D-alanine dipeptidase [Sodalis praecaptivus]AHF79281.1 D-alanyl-D-alanine dipeptidase [Sodalis praecaptivus]